MLKNDEIAIKRFWEKQHYFIETFNIKTQDDFVRYCIEMRKQKNQAVLLSIIKYLIECGEELDRLTALERRLIGQAADLDAIMRNWVKSMPVFSFSLLFLMADVCFPHIGNDTFTPGVNFSVPNF